MSSNWRRLLSIKMSISCLPSIWLLGKSSILIRVPFTSSDDVPARLAIDGFPLKVAVVALPGTLVMITCSVTSAVGSV